MALKMGKYKYEMTDEQLEKVLLKFFKMGIQDTGELKNNRSLIYKQRFEAAKKKNKSVIKFLEKYKKRVNRFDIPDEHVSCPGCGHLYDDEICTNCEECPICCQCLINNCYIICFNHLSKIPDN